MAEWPIAKMAPAIPQMVPLAIPTKAASVDSPSPVIRRLNMTPKNPKNKLTSMNTLAANTSVIDTTPNDPKKNQSLVRRSNTSPCIRVISAATPVRIMAGAMSSVPAIAKAGEIRIKAKKTPHPVTI